jgi:hypothetical protein
VISLALVGAVALVAPGVVVGLWVPRTSPRWSLAVTFAITVPVFGALLALVAFRTRGTNQIERDLERPTAPVQPVAAEDVARMGGLPPLLDRLMSADPLDRLSGLEVIRRRPDRDGIALLRWTISHGSSDSVLDAALTLEEVEIGWRRNLDDAVGGLGDAPSITAAIRAADLVIDGINSGLVDDAIVDVMTAEARDRCDRAVELDPSRTQEVCLRRARLELAAGQPAVALDMLDAVRATARTWTAELGTVRDRARFAMRHKPSREIARTVFAPG